MKNFSCCQTSDFPTVLARFSLSILAFILATLCRIRFSDLIKALVITCIVFLATFLLNQKVTAQTPDSRTLLLSTSQNLDNPNNSTNEQSGLSVSDGKISPNGSAPAAKRALPVKYLPDRSAQLQYLDHEFARKYLKEAYLLSKEDRAVEVQKLLTLSKEYDGDLSSDYWYLLAVAHEEKWEKSRFDWLNKAFEIDQWFEVPPLEAALELIPILYKWNMFDDIVTWTQKWSREILDNKDIQYYLALAYNNSGQKKKAIELSLNNLEQYDYDERYFRILLDTPNVTKDMWVNFHFYLENYPPNSPQLLRYLISRSMDINHTENLLSFYTSLFGDDYFTTAQRIILRQDSLIPRSDIFFNNYETSDFLILSKVIRSVSGVRPIEESLQNLNGLYIIDQNYDNVPEEELTFINGNLVERHIFPSRPSENDINIRWNGYGEPSSYHSFFNHNGNSRTIDILYGRYPFIREITVTDHDSRRVYSFSPGHLAYTISQEIPLNTFDWAISPLQRPSLLESEIMRNSKEVKLYETQMRQSDWKLRAKYNINYLGELKEIQIDNDMDGVFEEISYFDKSQRVRTIRDVDQDGNFELSINYHHGVPQKYEVDTDGSGNVDFTEVLGDISSKTWHTYGDSIPPSSAYKYEPEKTDFIYSYYFKWSQQTINVFAPEYFETQK